jgi:hypothetical protein
VPRIDEVRVQHMEWRLEPRALETGPVLPKLVSKLTLYKTVARQLLSSIPYPVQKNPSSVHWGRIVRTPVYSVQ